MLLRKIKKSCTLRPTYLSQSMQTFALLGSHPEISLAEINAVTGSLPTSSASQIALFDDTNWNFSDLQEKLGGSQKLGVVIGTVSTLNEQELAAFITADLVEQVPEGKVNFGISIYGDDQAKLDAARTELKNLGFTLKTALKEAGRSARYVISKDATLSSVVLKKNDLLTKGAEYVFLVRKNDIVIGKTLAAQDVDEWSHRDMDRPRRNAKQGMLPPKLARIMANLATRGGRGSLLNATVLDPFCGSGTVLMEAGLMGAKALIGGDIAPMAIADTKTNMDWVKKEHPEVPEVALYTMRASDLGNALEENTVDYIITETYLGRPRKGNESREEIEETLEYVKTVYEESFSELKKILKSGARVVLTCPVHVFEDEMLTFDAVTLMNGLGYKEEKTEFSPLIYRHGNQMVGRQIFVFTA